MNDEIMAKIAPEGTPTYESRLLAEGESCLTTRPTAEALIAGDDDAIAWLGRTQSVLGKWNCALAVSAIAAEREIFNAGKHAPIPSERFSL